VAPFRILLVFGIVATPLYAHVAMASTQWSYIEARLELYRHIAMREAGGCHIFDMLGPAARCVERIGSTPSSHPCDPTVGYVGCHRDNAGWYVPFAVDARGCESWEICHGGVVPDLSSWTLWYVPFDERLPVRLVIEQLALEESDLKYTTLMQVTDLGGDGAAKLVLGRGWAHVEGVEEGKDVFVVTSEGRQFSTVANRIQDVDDDGLYDIILDFTATTTANRCTFDENDPWDSDGLSGPSLLFHATAPGVYTTEDEIAQRFRTRDCKFAKLPTLNRKGRIIDERQTATEILCHLANGGSPEDAHRAIDNACSVPYELEKDCRNFRPNVCQFADVLHNWIDRFYRATVFSRGWEPMGQCERCCPLATSKYGNIAARPTYMDNWQWPSINLVY
jgi:hypothetical protein